MLNVQQWHLIYIYIYFYYVGKICTFTLDCCSLNFLKVMQCYVYIYRTKIKVICLNMRVAMCSLSRVSNGNMIQVSRLKITRSCKCEFYESLHSLFWFLHSWISLCECQPALKISSFTPKHHQTYSPYCSLNIFQGTDKENLFNNQELLKLVIISFILLIIKFDPGMMLMLYIVSHRVKGFNEDVHVHVNVGHFADGCFASVSSQFPNV